MKRLYYILVSFTLLNIALLGASGYGFYRTVTYTDPTLNTKLEEQFYRGWTDNCISMGVVIFQIAQTEVEGVCRDGVVTLQKKDWYHKSHWVKNWKWPINNTAGDAATNKGVPDGK